LLTLCGGQVINESSIVYGCFFSFVVFTPVLFSLIFFKKMMGYQNNLQKLDLVCRLSETSLSF